MGLFRTKRQYRMWFMAFYLWCKYWAHLTTFCCWSVYRMCGGVPVRRWFNVLGLNTDFLLSSVVDLQFMFNKITCFSPLRLYNRYNAKCCDLLWKGGWNGSSLKCREKQHFYHELLLQETAVTKTSCGLSQMSTQRTEKSITNAVLSLLFF